MNKPSIASIRIWCLKVFLATSTYLLCLSHRTRYKQEKQRNWVNTRLLLLFREIYSTAENLPISSQGRKKKINSFKRAHYRANKHLEKQIPIGFKRLSAYLEIYLIKSCRLIASVCNVAILHLHLIRDTSYKKSALAFWRNS